jgi:NYN domain
MIAPAAKRVIGFIDGQNLFYAARQAFGYSYPNFDPKRLTEVVAAGRGWLPAGTRFYTGVPDAADNPFWNHFWTAKVGAMGRHGVISYTRPLRYRNQTITLPDGRSTTTLVGQEKGIDVRIALDIVRLARANEYDLDRATYDLALDPRDYRPKAVAGQKRACHAPAAVARTPVPFTCV